MLIDCKLQLRHYFNIRSDEKCCKHVVCNPPTYSVFLRCLFFSSTTPNCLHRFHKSEAQASFEHIAQIHQFFCVQKESQPGAPAVVRPGPVKKKFSDTPLDEMTDMPSAVMHPFS